MPPCAHYSKPSSRTFVLPPRASRLRAVEQTSPPGWWLPASYSTPYLALIAERECVWPAAVQARDKATGSRTHHVDAPSRGDAESTGSRAGSRRMNPIDPTRSHLFV